MASLAFVLSGCATKTASGTGLKQVGLAITMPHGQQVSTKQLLEIQEMLKPELARQGYELEQQTGAATEVVVVHFTPDQFAKSGGHIRIVGLQPKPRRRQEQNPSTDADAVIRRALENHGGAH